jgi:hypothetical protein
MLDTALRAFTAVGAAVALVAGSGLVVVGLAVAGADTLYLGSDLARIVLGCLVGGLGLFGLVAGLLCVDDLL